MHIAKIYFTTPRITVKVKVKKILIPYAVCIFWTHFLKVRNEFSRRFFQKVLPLRLVSIQERVMMVYSICMQNKLYINWKVCRLIMIWYFYKIESSQKLKVKWFNNVWINICCFVSFLPTNILNAFSPVPNFEILWMFEPDPTKIKYEIL